MRKHLKKAISLALSAAMAISLVSAEGYSQVSASGEGAGTVQQSDEELIPVATAAIPVASAAIPGGGEDAAPSDVPEGTEMPAGSGMPGEVMPEETAAPDPVFLWKDTREGDYDYSAATTLTRSDSRKDMIAEQEFTGGSLSLPYSLAAPAKANIAASQGALYEALRDEEAGPDEMGAGEEQEMPEYSINGLTWQWYVNGEKLEGEDFEGRYLYFSDLGAKYPELRKRKLSNAEEKTEISCRIRIKSVSDNDADYLLEDYGLSCSLNFEYCYHYTGPTKERIREEIYDLDDYFSFYSDNALDEKKITYHYYRDGLYYDEDGYQVSQLAFSGWHMEHPDVTLNYVWKAYSVDGEEAVVREGTKEYTDSWGTDITYTPEKTESFGESQTNKMVDHYVCEVQVLYGEQELAGYSRRFQMQYSPLYITTSEGVSDEDGTPHPVTVRDHGKQTFYAKAGILDEEVVKSVAYQWYSIDGDGEETEIKGETTDTLKQKITNNKIRYKCKIRARMHDGYGGKVKYSTERIFTTARGSGYYVRQLTNRQATRIGKPVALDITPVVDDGYTLKYKWQKITGYDSDADGDEDYNTLVLSDSIGSRASLEVVPEKAEDFQGYYGRIYDRDGNVLAYADWANYFLTVAVQDSDGETVETYYYPCRVTEDTDISFDNNGSWHEGGRTEKVTRGSGAVLYAKPENDEGFRLEQTWYRLIAKAEIKNSTWTDEDEYVYTYTDSEFVEPETADWINTEYRWGDGESHGYRYFYQEITSKEDGTVCELPGKINGRYNDTIPGEYICRIQMKRDGSAGTEEVAVNEDICYYTVRYDSGLSVYAKTSRIKASAGGSAELEVAAQNNDETLYPITYTWKRKDVETGGYQVIEGADGSVLRLEDIGEEDFTDYQAVVEDVAHSDALDGDGALTVSFTVARDAVKVVRYTPEHSWFRQAVGDRVALRASLGVTKGTGIFYEWYREEKKVTADGRDDTDYWEILNQDTDEYVVHVQGEDDYATYKCVASLKTADGEGNSITEEHVFYFHVQSDFSFRLEQLTPQSQKKKPGDSASYGVRLITDYPDLDESDVAYQWYYYDENGEKVVIEGEEESWYTVGSLESADFGRLYCSAVYGEQELSATVSFVTQLYSEAYLKNNHEEIKAGLGSDVTLQPEIEDADGMELEYQWYRRTADGGSSFDYNYTKIYGADKESYTISNVGENELTDYCCEIKSSGASLFTYYVKVVRDENPGRLRIDVADGFKQEVKALLKDRAEFAVTVASNRFEASELRYQWYTYGYDVFSGIYQYKAIGGAVDDSYVIDSVTMDSYGSYRCVVTAPNGNTAHLDFKLSRTVGLQVVNDDTYGYDTSGSLDDTVGYQAAFGGKVTLQATATAADGYTLFYQWYHYDGETRQYREIYGGQNATLELEDISEEDLGGYMCEVSTAAGESERLYYLVYVDTGLSVVPGAREVSVQEDGTVKMFVKAQADEGEEIHYKWFKWEIEQPEEESIWNDDIADSSDSVAEDKVSSAAGEWKEIPDEEGNTYALPELKKENYGEYLCEVSTRGQKQSYSFSLAAGYSVTADRTFAEQGDTARLRVEISNPAVDAEYSYAWYEQDSATGTYHRVKEETANYTAEISEMKRNQCSGGYASIGYRCIIRDAAAEDEGEVLETVGKSIGVLAKFNYGADMPETNHPNDENWNVQGYRIEGATKIKVTFDGRTDLGNAALYIIDQAGQYKRYHKSWLDVYNASYPDRGIEINEDTVAVGESLILEGDRAIFLMNGNSDAASYGYKVASIEKIEPVEPEASAGPVEPETSAGPIITPGAPDVTGISTDSGIAANNTPSPAADIVSKSSVSTLPLKGTKVTKGNLIYKVTKSSAKKGTVSVIGVTKNKKKKVANINIPAAVKITKYQFKVTAIGNNALSGCEKLRKVTIGPNVAVIGTNAFANDKKLKKITIKTIKLKKIGKKAFDKVGKKAVAKVPKSKKSAYKKQLRKSKFKGKVK